MPNSFTVFPNVLPGNVTIGGNLTVSGDQLQIGAAPPFVRVGKDTIQRARLAFNQALNFSARDTAAIPSAVLSFELDGSIYKFSPQNSAGTFLNDAQQLAIFTDYVVHNNTGNTTENTIYSKLIPANTLGANGGLDIRFLLSALVQGATQATVRIKFGGTLLVSFNFTAIFNAWVDIAIRNRNAVNTGTEAITFRGISGTIPAGSNGSHAVDFSVDETLIVTVQNGTSTDSQNFEAMSVHQLNSFGPV